MKNRVFEALTTVDNSYMIVWSVRRCQHLGERILMKKHLALYGSIKIPRGYCNKCRQYALIIDGIIQCCDQKVEIDLENKARRMVEAYQMRRRPSRQAIRNMIEIQGNRCIYCDIPFDTSYEHPKFKKFMKTKLCCDHFVPYAYSQDNRDINFVLACGTCNGIKSDLIFNTLEEAKIYVEYRRAQKGFKKEIYIL